MFDFFFSRGCILIFIFQYFYPHRTTDTFSRISGNVAFFLLSCKCQSHFLQLLVLILVSWNFESLVHTSTRIYCYCSAETFFLQLDKLCNWLNLVPLMVLKKNLFFFFNNLVWTRIKQSFFLFFLFFVQCQLPVTAATGATRFPCRAAMVLTRMTLDMILHLLH